MDGKIFYEKHREAFLNLIQFPLITCCKYKNQLIPYEYAPKNQALKYWRTEKSLQEFFSNHPEFMPFCLQNNIQKYWLQIISGGNLFCFKLMKEAGF